MNLFTSILLVSANPLLPAKPNRLFLSMIQLKAYKRPVLVLLVIAFLSCLTFGQWPPIEGVNGELVFPVMVLLMLSGFYFVSQDFFKKFSLLFKGMMGAIVLYILALQFLDLSGVNGIFNFIALPIPFFMILWFFEKWKWVKSLEAAKEDAELALLKSQINPHFFFNTLNNLHALAVKKSDDTPEVILKLSELMRYTIYEGENDRVSLQTEVDCLNNYIDLHKIRHKRNVDIRFESAISEELKVTPLLFVTLLENAFKHGVETVNEGAFIHMKLVAEKEEIIFTVKNSFERKSGDQEKGIGLKNLKKRLELIYPDRHQLNIVQTDDIFAVTLSIKNT